MAKKKIRVTDAMAKSAEPTFTKFMTTKLNAMGAREHAKIFKGNGPLRRKQSKKWYQRFIDDGGKVGDFQSFMEWLLEHADEIISFLSKIIALFTVAGIMAGFSSAASAASAASGATTAARGQSGGTKPRRSG